MVSFVSCVLYYNKKKMSQRREMGGRAAQAGQGSWPDSEPQRQVGARGVFWKEHAGMGSK